MDNDCLAELVGVSKRFGSVVALNNLDLTVDRGELLAVLGPNGAGKTTAISLLLGLQRPDRGSIRLFGQSPSLLEVRRQVGVMMQEAALPAELKVREQIDLIRTYYSDPLSVADVLGLTHLTSLGNRLYGKLSTGQKRQAQFAVAICGRPRLLFLDEPTVGLDIQTREMVWSVLRKLVDDGVSIVLTTHYLEEAEALADRVAVISKGHLLTSGSVNEMRSLVVRTCISCSTSLDIDEVRKWPGVGSVSRQRERLQVTATNAETVVRRLLAADQDLQELEVRRAGLADVFTELTQEAA